MTISAASSAHALLEALPDPHLVLGAGGKVLGANALALGLIPPSHHGLPILADAPVPPPEFTLVVHGERRVMSTAWMPVTWDGAPARLVRLQDVTEQRREEGAQDEGYRILEELFDALPAAIVVLSTTGVIVSANAAWRVAVRERTEDVPNDGVGLDYAELAGRVVGMESASYAGFERGLREVLDRRSLSFEHEFQRSLGTRHEYYRAQVTALQWTAGAVVVHSDITAIRSEQQGHQQALAQFRAVFEQAIDAMVLCDDDGRIHSANDAAAAMFGLSMASLRARPLLEVIDAEPAQREAFRALRHRLADLGVARAPMRVRRPDGQARETDCTARARVVPGRHLFVFHDLTDTLRLEAQLRHSQKIEALGELTGGIAHDFNNVLTIIRGNAEYLLTAADGVPMPPRMHEGLVAVADAAGRGAEMVRKLMAFSRRDHIVRTPQRIDALLQDAASLLRRVLPEHVQISVAVPSGIPPVSLDQSSFQQIVLNLATNARDAVPDRGGEIRFTLAHRDGAARPGGPTDGGHVELCVEDNGAGMDEATLQRVFEPFFTTKSKEKGTGLGMAMVYGLMAQHDGSIEVASTRGFGTRVTLRFPTTRAEVAPAVISRPDALPGGHERILVAEDEAAIRKLAVQVLRQKGYEVTDVASGNAARRLLEESPDAWDLVVSDVVMPDGGGAEVEAAVEAVNPTLPIVWMTGYAVDGLPVKRSGTVGYRHAIEKPWTLASLLGAVRDALNAGHRGRRDGASATTTVGAA